MSCSVLLLLDCDIRDIKIFSHGTHVCISQGEQSPACGSKTCCLGDINCGFSSSLELTTLTKLSCDLAAPWRITEPW